MRQRRPEGLWTPGTAGGNKGYKGDKGFGGKGFGGGGGGGYGVPPGYGGGQMSWPMNPAMNPFMAQQYGGHPFGPMGGRMPPRPGYGFVQQRPGGFMPGFGMQPMQRMPPPGQRMMMASGGMQHGMTQGGGQGGPSGGAPHANKPRPQQKGSVDLALLSSMSPDQQKNFLGEKLYGKISGIEGDSAAKITGMLLEMDNSELVNLLDSPDMLRAKVTEAMQVLNEHATR